MPENRFLLLSPGQARPGRVPLPPSFAVKAATEDTEGRFSLLEVHAEFAVQDVDAFVGDVVGVAGDVSGQRDLEE